MTNLNLTIKTSELHYLDGEMANYAEYFNKIEKLYIMCLWPLCFIHITHLE